MQTHLIGGLSGLCYLSTDTFANRQTIHIRVEQAVLLGCLKVGAGACLAAILMRVLDRVSKSLPVTVCMAELHLLIHNTMTSPSAIELPLRASCNSLILLKLKGLASHTCLLVR